MRLWLLLLASVGTTIAACSTQGPPIGVAPLGASNPSEPEPPLAGTDGGKTSGAGDAGDRGTASCIEDADPFAVATLQRHLNYLAAPALDGRAPGTPGDAAARDYYAQQFSCFGVLPGGVDGGYTQPVVNVNGVRTANVLAYLPGRDPRLGHEIILVGAHMDHFGDGRLGANDNASGTVAVLSAAQAFAQRAAREGLVPKRTVAFVTWASEEVAYDGSRHYVDHPTELPELPFGDVVYYINYDMIGSYTVNGGEVDACGAVGDTPAAGILKSLTPKSGLNVKPRTGYGADDSDYYSFCQKGIPYVSFEMDDPPCYHKACDTADRIDFVNMAKIAKLSADLAMQLVDTADDLKAYKARANVGQLGCPSDD